MDIDKSWNNWLRRASRPSGRLQKAVCPLCNQELQPAAELAVFEKHVATDHVQLLQEKASDEDKAAWIQSLWKAAQPAGEMQVADPPPGAGAAPATETRVSHQEPDADSAKRSPASSLKREGSRSRSPPRRPKARPTSTPKADDGFADFKRGPPPKGRLWSPDDDAQTTRPPSYDKSNVATNHRLRVSSIPGPRSQRSTHQSQASSLRTPANVEEDSTELIKQPETRPISQEQLVAEVKGIYAGLVLVESKCIEVDAQNAKHDPSTKLNNEQWQALIALHRTLLHEHHDFFLASQHPSASPALRRLASKYAMPARMWRHGIHSFLELLRHRLPASLEHMLSFIYLAYSMMALLYETVPAFEDTWIECLGDLGRYRMAIEDEDIRDREVWTSVSRHWYSKASDKAPTTGRLYHHLAILARPNALQQLYYYTKSLCVAVPFSSARESIMTLFDPIMAPNSTQQSRLGPTDLAFVKTHGIMFSGKMPEKLESSMDEFLSSLDGTIARSTRSWLEPAYHIGISNCAAILGYGSDRNPMFSAIKQIRSSESHDQHMLGGWAEDSAPQELAASLKLANGTHDVVLRRFGDPNILPYLHVILVFVHYLTFAPAAMSYLAPGFPWKLTAHMLNTLLDSYQTYSRIEGNTFPQAENAPKRPLPEDYAMRGLLWADKYFPDEWFSSQERIDDDEKYFEVPSMSEDRKERALYLGCRIAAQGGKWLRYNSETHQFSVSPQYDIELDAIPFTPAGSADSVDYGELPDASGTA
ncbi:hypothetical protein B0T24DRAFT_566133 [Lasiosphaeria ovina]|uniref:DNA/RNA-binding domain-containing protein n=1 Tax=Lasiosphaeria ovina TaxID=92902 RepID=A0AAE0NKW1_9PEZI|nr:hypothetical protein B0T24DRAFT_566133 [Lasiosphaeria ovina]